MPKINKINHVAIVVEDIDDSLSFWKDALGIEVSEQRDVPMEKSKIAFLPCGDGEIELVQPTSNDSGIAKYLNKRGQGMHHICLEVDDLDGMISQLLKKGIRMINEQARISSDGRHYAFIHPESSSGVLVELYQV